MATKRKVAYFYGEFGSHRRVAHEWARVMSGSMRLGPSSLAQSVASCVRVTICLAGRSPTAMHLERRGAPPRTCQWPVPHDSPSFSRLSTCHVPRCRDRQLPLRPGAPDEAAPRSHDSQPCRELWPVPRDGSVPAEARLPRSDDEISQRRVHQFPPRH